MTTPSDRTWHSSESGELCYDVVEPSPSLPGHHACARHLDHVAAGADHECCCGVTWPVETREGPPID